MKNQQVKCVCGASYWPAQAWQHKHCEPASNTVDNASNNISVASNIDDGVISSASNKQRWDRSKYNEYMRNYMKAKRNANSPTDTD